jgi:hypothetical protein
VGAIRRNKGVPAQSRRRGKPRRRKGAAETRGEIVISNQIQDPPEERAAVKPPGKASKRYSALAAEKTLKLPTRLGDGKRTKTQTGRLMNISAYDEFNE